MSCEWFKNHCIWIVNEWKKYSKWIVNGLKSIVYELWMGEKYCEWIVNGLKSIVNELWMV
jgi:hypothetical protein